MATKMVNLTPHTINFITNGIKIAIEPSDEIARVTCTSKIVDIINEIPVTENEYGEVTGLPDPEEGTIYIVSSLVAQRCKDRNDVFIPSDSIRDEKGRIIGCKSLGRV